MDDDVGVFAYDGYGQIIERRDGTAAGDVFSQASNTTHENQHYVYVNGQQVAHYDEGGTLDVIDQVTAFDNSGAGTSGYIVQAGDSLRSIAQAVYGNASYWYIIAQANALTSDNDLAIGQNLSIPQVTTTANTATTFKPYNPSDIAGSTTPNLPTIAPPPVPPAHHCNIVAAIVVIAVIVVATILTAGALAPAAAGAGASLFSAGAAVLSGAAGLSAATVATAFAAGVAGNLAGQVVGDALGTHSGISLGEAFVGGFTAAATAGLGAELSPGAGLSNAFVGAKGLTALGGAVEGAGAYAGNVVGSHLVGQKSQFSWAGLVAAAVSGGAVAGLRVTPVGQQVGQTTGSFAGDVGAGLLRGEINSEVSRSLGDKRGTGFDSVVESAVGTAIGNAAASALSPEAPMTAQANMAKWRNGGVDDSFDFTRAGTGVGGSADPLASYNPADSQMFASVGPYEDYSALHGTIGGDDAELPPIPYDRAIAGPSSVAFDIQDGVPSHVESLYPGRVADSGPWTHSLSTDETVDWNGLDLGDGQEAGNSVRDLYNYANPRDRIKVVPPLEAPTVTGLEPVAADLIPVPAPEESGYDSKWTVGPTPTTAASRYYEREEGLAGTLQPGSPAAGAAAGAPMALRALGDVYAAFAARWNRSEHAGFDEARNPFTWSVVSGTQAADIRLSTAANVVGFVVTGPLAAGEEATISGPALAARGSFEAAPVEEEVAGAMAGQRASTTAPLEEIDHSLNLAPVEPEGVPNVTSRAIVPNSTESASSVNPAATLRDYLGELDQNTMVHLTSAPQEAFEKGINPGTFFARYGDVAHLTPQQYRIGVVGPVAGGYGPEANLFVTVSPANSEEFFSPWESAFGYVEWQNLVR